MSTTVFGKQIDFTALKTILFFGLVIRLIAAIFSKGYGMHDDHYLVVEAAGSWADGYDYNDWLPWSKEVGASPEGHSFTYVGLNFILFSILKFFGIHNPQVLMLINRLIHALFSLLIIHFGYKITERLSNKSNAVYVGWMLALLWAMPFLSVRNLVEVVSIPFLMWSVWLTLNDQKKYAVFYAGVLVGVAVSFRYQIAIYGVGMGIYYLMNGKWKAILQYGLGATLMFCLTQGLVDGLIWGYPFAEFIAYTTYNMNQGMEYLKNSNYFMYFYVLFGFMLFPLGILGLIGYFISVRKYAILFIPTFLFLLFHTWFPNRQERFIITIFPLVIALAIMGFETLRTRKFWAKTWNFSWIAFWVLNIPLLMIISTMTSKKSRMDTMYALYGNTTGKEHILIEATGETNPEMMPFFYAGKWEFTMLERWKGDTTAIENYKNQELDIIFFFGKEGLKQRIESFKAIYPKMKLQEAIEPGFVDKTLHKINKRNSNSYVEIWRTGDKWK